MELNSSKSSDIQKIISDNKYFIVPFIILFSLFLTLLGFQGNDRLFLEVNGVHSKITDFLFLYLTNFGNGVIAFLLVIILLWVSFREAITFLFLTIVLTILVDVLKKFIFPGFDRPVWYFGASALHLISGYQPPLLHTFPSGHSVTAFSMCLYLSFLVHKKLVKLMLFIVAAFIGYSRIYLSAHFPFDVIFGALIGVVITTLVFQQSRRLENSWIDKRLKLNMKFLIDRKVYDSKSFR